jgi:hypothetical protein
MSSDPSDKMIESQTLLAAQADLEWSPLAPAVSGAGMLIVCMGINLLGVVVLQLTESKAGMCLSPVAMLVGAGAASVFCSNSSARTLGITTRWPFWLSVVNCMTAIVALVCFMWIYRGLSSQASKLELRSMDFLLGLMLLSFALCYVAAMHRAAQYGRVRRDRLQQILAATAQVAVVVNFCTVAGVYIYTQLVPRADLLFIHLAIIVMYCMPVCMILVLYRTRWLLRRAMDEGIPQRLPR